MCPSRHKLKIVALLPAVLFALLIPALAQSRPEENADTRGTKALVIGISKYPNLPGGFQLRFAENDASSILSVFLKGSFQKENIVTLTGPTATVAAVRDSLNGWAANSVNSSDTFILFFSGHGLVDEKTKEPYLLTVDSKTQSPDTTSLSIKELKHILSEKIKARRIALIIDALRPDFFDVKTEGASLFINRLEELSSMRDGITVIAGCGPGEFSREGQRWDAHGVFTKKLLDAFASQGGGDAGSVLTLDQAFKLISSSLPSDTSNKQHPWRCGRTGSDIALSALSQKSSQAARMGRAESGTGKKEPEPAHVTGNSQNSPKIIPEQKQKVLERPEQSGKPSPLPPGTLQKKDISPSHGSRDESISPEISSASKEPKKRSEVPGQKKPPDIRPMQSGRNESKAEPAQPKPLPAPARLPGIGNITIDKIPNSPPLKIAGIYTGGTEPPPPPEPAKSTGSQSRSAGIPTKSEDSLSPLPQEHAGKTITSPPPDKPKKVNPPPVDISLNALTLPRPLRDEGTPKIPRLNIEAHQPPLPVSSIPEPSMIAVSLRTVGEPIPSSSITQPYLDFFRNHPPPQPCICFPSIPLVVPSTLRSSFLIPGSPDIIQKQNTWLGTQQPPKPGYYLPETSTISRLNLLGDKKEFVIGDLLFNWRVPADAISGYRLPKINLTGIIYVNSYINPVSKDMGLRPFVINTAQPPRPGFSLPVSETIYLAVERLGLSISSAGIDRIYNIRLPAPYVLEVESCIEKGMLISPSGANAWELYQILRVYPEAKDDLLRLNPLMGDAFLKSGISTVTESPRINSLARKTDEFKTAELVLSRVRIFRPEEKSTIFFEKLCSIYGLIALQFYDEAEKALLNLQPAKQAYIENAFGLIHIGRLNEWQAERAFRRAIELDHGWAIPHYNLGLLYKNQMKSTALDEFVIASALNPRNPAIISTLADEYFSLQNWQLAAETYKKAISLCPQDDSLHTKLGHSYYSLGLKNEADQEYKEARKISANPHLGQTCRD